MRAAVVGTHWGQVHVAALREAGVEVVALCGRDLDETAATAARLGVARATTDLTDLAHADLDLVTVATPPTTHVDVIDALPDLPVLCEKPAVGLGTPRALAGRTRPVRVNYAFGFLEVARRAAAALDRIGAVQAAHVVSTHDLPDRPGRAQELFMELVPHPWAWLVALLGPAAAVQWERAPDRRRDGDPAVSVIARCGTTPITLESVHSPGSNGIAHSVELVGGAGRLRLHGSYRVGQPWRFSAPVLDTTRDSGRAGLPAAPARQVQELGVPEEGPGDPWYRANARAVAAFVDMLRGGPDAPLLDWAAALAMDAAAQSGLRSAGWPSDP